MIKKWQIIVITSCIALLSCEKKHQEDFILTIPLQENRAIIIDGELEEQEWTGSQNITTFISPWEEGDPPETSFYVCADKSFLYFAFQAIDNNIVVTPSDNEDDVALGDRVEIFFTGDKKLQEYYCIEIAPYGNILDYKASFYRVFDNRWNAPGLQTKTSVKEDGYVVEGKMPLSFISDIKGSKDNIKNFYMGVYRADFTKNKKGKDSVLWLTWIDPMVEEADFHIPSSFGKVCIE